MNIGGANTSNSGWRNCVIISVFAIFVAFAGLFSLPPLDRDEARFAQAATQMLETGDFVTIKFQDRERNKKPAGIYWLQAASVAAFSEKDAREIWAYRVPSIIGVVFAGIFTYLIAVRLYDEKTGLLAGLLLASAPVVAAEATIAKADGVLLACVTAAQLAFVHIYANFREGRPANMRWPLAFWLAHGAGVLIKGPISPVISAMTGIGLLTAKPHFAWIKRMRPFTGAALLAFSVAPWAIAIGVATEGRFFTQAIGGDMLGKVGAAQESHSGPPGYHTALVWILFWPASALIYAGLLHTWRDRGNWPARFLLAWVIPAWLLFEFSATKLPHYVMPLYPALAIIAAHAAVRDGAAVTLSRRFGAVLYLLVGCLAAALVAFLPLFFSEAPLRLLSFIAAALILAASASIATLFWRGRAFEGGCAAAVLAAIYAWTLMAGELPSLSKLALSPRLTIALETLDRHPIHDDAQPVALAGYSEPSAIFLLGTDTILTTGAGAAHQLLREEIGVAVIEKREAEAFFSVIGAAPIVEKLAVISGLNYSNGKSITLTVYGIAPKRDHHE